MFAIPDVFKEFIVDYLPRKLLESIDLATLKPVATEFIDLRKKQHFVDILYEARCYGFADSEEGYIYIHVEHQSTIEKLMPWRISQYKNDIIQRHLIAKKTKNKLPFVYSIVLYHGVRKYKYSMNINSLIAYPKEITAEFLHDSVQLVDMAKVNDEQLQQKTLYGHVLLALKYSFKIGLTLNTNLFVNDIVKKPHVLHILSVILKTSLPQPWHLA